MNDDTTFVEGVDAALGTIKELVGNDQIAGSDVFTEAADGTDGDDPFDAQAFECPDVGTDRNFGGRDAVTSSVAGEKGHGDALYFANGDDVARVAEGCLYGHLFNVDHTFHTVETAAADDADGCLWHWRNLLCFNPDVVQLANFENSTVTSKYSVLNITDALWLT